MNAPGGHAVAGVEHHADGLVVMEPAGVAQQELRLAGLRKLGRAAEAAVLGVVAVLEESARIAQDRGGQHQAGREAVAGAQLLQARMDIRRRLGQFGAARLPEPLYLLQELEEARPAMTVVRREIGAAVEGLQVRREKHVERPPALTARRLDEGHIDLIHVRAFLPIHFDADKVRVEEGSHLRIFEGFALHHVAPMAGRVADAEEDRLVFAARLGEGFFAPGKPVHRVMLVLEEVGRFLAGEAVRVAQFGNGGCIFHNGFRYRFNGSQAACGQTQCAGQRQGGHGASVHGNNHSPLQS